MDVISLHKFGIKNVAANLGTAMTEKQMDLISRFYKNLIICLDGDESGQKAAIRAAERLFPLVRSDFNIFFLTLPKDIDPDNFVHEKGKDSFLNFSKNKKEIHNFIWDSYLNETDKKSPQSLALFEKKLKEICNQIKDKTIRKYFLEDFLRRFDEFTPTLTSNKKRNINFRKRQSPLQETKRIYNQRNKFSERVLKEYSIFYLIINNLNYFQDKIEHIAEIEFSDNLFNNFKKQIISYCIADKTNIKDKLDNKDFDGKYSEMINNINKFAPVKSITENKGENDLLNIFQEIIDEIKQIELNNKIERLETKVAKEMDQKLYDELLSLKSHLKSG